MTSAAAGAVRLAALIALIAFQATLAGAGEAAPSDDEVLAIVHRHCAACHAQKPVHPSFAEAPKGVTLETLEQIQRFAAGVYEQTIVTRAMPMGNETAMSEEERDRLAAWIRSLK
jgi:uncharacterized membrane protein